MTEKGNKMEEKNDGISVNIDDLSSYKCRKCGSVYFDSVVEIKKIGKDVSPDGIEKYVPITVFVCTTCGAHDYNITKKLVTSQKKQNEEEVKNG